jgi:ribose 5-phosphate isomerase B
MKIAVASDERTHLTDTVVAELKEKGHEVKLFGPLAGKDTPWPVVSQQLAESVVSGETEEGVLFCWTGTGASIAANKVPGIRAALCRDAETARGARWWNDANVLVMSLRATPEAVAQEILEAWFSEKVLPEEKEFIAQVREIERKYSRAVD